MSAKQLLAAVFGIALLFSNASLPGSAAAQTAKACARCIRAHEEFLASDALGGRGSGTRDEQIAATYIASELRQYGVLPGVGTNVNDLQSYIQEFVIDLELPPERLAKMGPAVASGKLASRNVIGILPGSDPRLRKQIVLLSAHMDHLGTLPEQSVNGDAIFNGADDDASGVSAVLEFARVLGSGPRPRRTVLFAFFGSEELGIYGAGYFLRHPTVAINRLVANLEFEMIGRPDQMIAPHMLWLTGFEMSDLGAQLARHGADLVADPHTAEQFFQRSDNYALAKRGVVAHTVSSFGLHGDYHRPSDDIAHLDVAHVIAAIQSMIGPVGWLVNSNFKPKWLPPATAAGK